MGNCFLSGDFVAFLKVRHKVNGSRGSRRDRYLGMTAAIPQVPVPTAMGMLSTVFSSGQMTTYNVYQLKIHEFLSIL